MGGNPTRMAHFGLSLAEEKCRLIEFGRFAEYNRERRNEGKPETFDFLGFTHICSKTKNGRFKVRRKTSRKKFVKKCKEMHDKIGKMRTKKTEEIIRWINQVLVGCYHYYGVNGNYPKVVEFRWNVLKSLYYWLNRRSQKRSYTKAGFFDMITKGHPVVRPKSFYVYIKIGESSDSVRSRMRKSRKSGICEGRGEQSLRLLDPMCSEASRKLSEKIFVLRITYMTTEKIKRLLNTAGSNFFILHIEEKMILNGKAPWMKWDE